MSSRAFDYMQVPLAIIATELTGLEIPDEGAYFRVARLLAVKGPMTLDAIRDAIGTNARVERRLNWRSTDVEPLLSIGWVEEWRERANAARGRQSEKGKASAAKRASKRKGRNRRSSSVEHTHHNGSTVVEPSTILYSTVRDSSGKERAREAPTLPFTSGAFVAAWTRWEKHRREKKQALTTSTRDAQFLKIKVWGEARAIAAIDHSIEQGYTGLFEARGATSKPELSTERKDLKTTW